ncbi:alkaline phosphatase family protein [Rhodohalobacter sp. 614A]|uniref:alkaline phosphatase family protein n=1 Tax=Rhodohalobacter sp. 614A TaxID=2908649 RepID=UPI001F29A2D1|nr:ectonucleotide pyrophosphatase/phosphodiesterase [Rhodohalobacter sp. 614A]
MKLAHKRIQTLFVCLSAISVLISCGPSENQVRSSSKEINPVLLISFDGFMNEYIDRNNTPNFDRFIKNGVKADYLIPVFPTKTFPNHYTIVTGLYVENHGIIANSFPDSRLDARFSYGPINSPNDERWWGGEPIWITAEKQGLTSATFFWPGSEASIDSTWSTKWVAYDGSVPDSSRIDSITAWLDPNGSVQADLGTLYFSFIDHVGHDFGPNSSQMDEASLHADDLLGYLLKKIDEHNLSDKLNVIITSDHGMAELSPEKVIFLDEIINLENVKMVDWTPVALIQPNEGETSKIYSTLKEHENNYRVYLRDELPDHYHFSDHYRIPEIIMIADVGYTITRRDFFEKNGVMGGTHGFDYEAPEMRTIFIASGPDFKTGETAQPFQSIHIYELLCKILGINPAENDGNLEEVNALLRN